MFKCTWSTQGEFSETAAEAKGRKIVFLFWWNLGLNDLDVSSTGARSQNDFSHHVGKMFILYIKPEKTS